MVQEQEVSELKPFVAADEEEDVHIEGTAQVQRQELELEQYGHGHDHEQAEGKGERPAAEQDEEGGSGIEGEEEVQVDVQGAVQSVGALGCLESVGHVPSVEPEPDAMQRYLEGSGP